MPTLPPALVLLASTLFPAPVPVACAAAAPAQGAVVDFAVEVTFAFWNVENLFDSEDDPANPGDDEYLPATGWDAARYGRKLDHLAQVIAMIDPHILGLSEVENRRVLEDLIRRPALAERGFRIAHLDSPDKRGIDLAVIYREPFVLAEGATPLRLHPIDIQPPTRGILEVPLVAHGRRLTVLVNHWPSRGGGEPAVAFRARAGDTAREVVAGIVARELEPAPGHYADVLLLGDFNDDPFDASLRDHLLAVRSRNAVLHDDRRPLLYNPTWRLLGTPDLGTYYYNRKWTWNVFDQAIVSRGLLHAEGVRFVEESLQVFAPAQLRDHYRRPRWFRKRGKRWAEGYSDHFPITGRLRVQAARGAQRAGDGD